MTYLVTWIRDGERTEETIEAGSSIDAMLTVIERERNRVNAIRCHPLPQAER